MVERPVAERPFSERALGERPKANLFGEVKRMARTSGAVGGIAARVAGERVFGLKTNKNAHAEDLKAVLGGLKGPLMKVAQILSTIPDALPPVLDALHERVLLEKPDVIIIEGQGALSHPAFSSSAFILRGSCPVFYNSCGNARLGRSRSTRRK